MTEPHAAEKDARCICGESHCRRCGVSAGAAIAGVLCDPPFAGSHDFPPRVTPTRKGRPMTADTPPEVVLSAELCREFCACRGTGCGHDRALQFVAAHLPAEQSAERLREQRDAWVERRDKMARRAREQRARAEAAERALADLRAGIKRIHADLAFQETHYAHEFKAACQRKAHNTAYYIGAEDAYGQAGDMLRALLATEDRP